MDEGEKAKNVREHSQIDLFTTTIIVVVLTVILGMSVSSWLAGQTEPFTDIRANINAKIYNPKHNIGILNEEVVFNINIINYENFTRMINVKIIAEDYFEKNKILNLEAMESMNVSITEKLIYPGIWTIKVLDEDEKDLDGYSFLVAINKGEANIKVSQWDDIQFNKMLSILAIALAVLGLIPDIIKFVKRAFVSFKR